MRNLKRVLSLSLASIMLLGMMVIGTSAAQDYSDVDYENDNIEAIEVLDAINVMRGDLDSNGNLAGTFRPGGEVKRSEMARIMAFLMDLDYDYYIGANPFTDMVGHWAEGYAAACAANGIIAGRTNTTYDPDATVTAVEAAAMLMRALGYFQNWAVDYADGFEISTVRQAGKINLFNKVDAKTNEPMTRNDVAQLVLNTLQSGMVEPSNNNKIDVTVGDAQVTIGSSNYVYTVARDPAVGRAINRTKATQGNSSTGLEGEILDLGEKLYDGKLKLNDDIDAFKRPVRRWEFNGEEIGLYIKEELMVYNDVGSVTGVDLYNLLGKNAVDNYKLSVALDGVTDPLIVRNITGEDKNSSVNNDYTNSDYVFNAEDINRNNKATVGATGVGVLTQVFVDDETDEIYIAIINTYLARATQDYDTSREMLPVTGYSIWKYADEYGKVAKNGKEGAGQQTFRVLAEEFPVVVDAKEKDAFLFTVAEGEIQTFEPAEVMAGVTISSFKSKENVVVDGTTYKFTTTAGYDHDTLRAYTDQNSNGVINLKDLTYNLYLDAYGNVIGVEEVEGVKNYVFVTAIDLNDSNLINGTADARGIFLDGTVDTIRVNMAKSTINTFRTNDSSIGGYYRNSILNTWCTYTVNNSGVYTLTQVKDLSVFTGTGFVEGAVPGDVDRNGKINNTGLAQYNQTISGAGQEITIDKKHITLLGGGAAGTEYAYVYGNEDTVYLTAELDELVNNATWGVIADVDTRTVGIENANITVWSDVDAAREAQDQGAIDVDHASYGVYTLYDKDGIVIAAVVVGEDNGTAKNLVYVHNSSVEYEAYNGESTRAAGDGLWTWTRKVISNGEEITLTEVSDGNSDLVKMLKGNWYQIKTNGDGEVTGVLYLPDGTANGLKKEAKLERGDDYALTWDTNYDYRPIDPNTGELDDRGEITYTIQEGKSTILYWNKDEINSRMRMNGRTLYVHTLDRSGFIVSNNVKWIVQRWDRNKDTNYFDEGTGAASLKSMIDEINNRYGNVDYYYHVSAIIEGGVATSVVIWDRYNDYDVPTGATSSKNEVTGLVGNWFSYFIPYDSTNKYPTTDQILNAVIEWLKDNEKITWDWDAGRGDRITGAFFDEDTDADGNVISTTEYYTIRHNGATYYVEIVRGAAPATTMELANGTEENIGVYADPYVEGSKKLTLFDEREISPQPSSIQPRSASTNDEHKKLHFHAGYSYYVTISKGAETLLSKAFPCTLEGYLEVAYDGPATGELTVSIKLASAVGVAGTYVSEDGKIDVDSSKTAKYLYEDEKGNLIEEAVVEVKEDGTAEITVKPIPYKDENGEEKTVTPTITVDGVAGDENGEVTTNPDGSVSWTGSASDPEPEPTDEPIKAVTVTMNTDSVYKATASGDDAAKVDVKTEWSPAITDAPVAGTEYTVTITVTAKTKDDGTSYTFAEDFQATWAVSGANITETSKDAKTWTGTYLAKKADPVVVGNDKYAVVKTSAANAETPGAIEFYSYAGESLADEDEATIISMLTAAIAKNTEIDAEDITVTLSEDGLTATANFGKNSSGEDIIRTYTLKAATATGSTAKPNALWLITIGEKSTYYLPGSNAETIKDLGTTKGKYYMYDQFAFIASANKADYVFQANDNGLYITGTPSSIFTTAKYDNGYNLTFVEAVKTAAITAGTDAGDLTITDAKVEFDNGTQVVTKTGASLTAAGDDYIPVGATLTIKVYADTKKSATVLVNGTTTVVSAVNSGSEKALVDVVIENVKGDKDNILTLAKFTGFTVEINGVKVDGSFSAESTQADLTFNVANAATYGTINKDDVFILVDKEYQPGALVKDVNTSGTGQIKAATVAGSTDTSRTLDLSSMKTLATDGVLRVYKAYKISAASAAIITKISNMEKTTIQNADQEVTTGTLSGTNDPFIYVIVGKQTEANPEFSGIYVTMKAAAAQTATILARKHDATSTNVKAVTSTDTTGVYQLTVGGTVAANDELALTTLKVTKDKAAGSFEDSTTSGVDVKYKLSEALGAGKNVDLTFATANIKDGTKPKVTVVSKDTVITVDASSAEVSTGEFTVNLAMAEDSTLTSSLSGVMATLKIEIETADGKTLTQTVEIVQYS